MATVNTWQKCRQSSGWSGGYAEWIEGDTAYLSVVFTWLLAKAYQRAVWLRAEGYKVRAGGPAVALHPDALEGVAEVGGQVDALNRHNPSATFTSRGCIRKCPFCVVPRIEGDLRELTDWEPRRIVCDNNPLACSQAHFDRMVDRLKPIHNIDFQGLDARLLTDYHAERLAELDLKVAHLAWDDWRLELPFMAAFDRLTKAGIPARKIGVYVLIGFNDTPEDALYRLVTIRDLGALPNPMRFQPLDAKRKNEYVGENWTHRELQRYMRYWSNLRVTRGTPFEEFASRGEEPRGVSQDTAQLQLLETT